MKRWGPFALLCGVASCVWMIMDRWPEVRFTLGAEAVACAIAVVVALGFTVRRPRGEGLWMAAVGGAMVLMGPSAGSLMGVSVDAGSLAIALALTAVVVAVVEAAVDGGEMSGEQLWPGMVACVGLLVVLSAPALGDWREDTALVLAPVMTGVGLVLFRRSGAGWAWKLVAGFAAGAAGLSLGWGVWREGVGISWPAVGVDFVLVGLALVVLGRVTASQYAARYAIVPLLILVEGVVLLHSEVNWRVGVCAVMLGVGAWGMLRGSREEKALRVNRG